MSRKADYRLKKANIKITKKAKLECWLLGHLKHSFKAILGLSHFVLIACSTITPGSICSHCTEFKLQAQSALPLSAYANFDLSPAIFQQSTKNQKPILHIYLEGDGSPYRTHLEPAKVPYSKSLTAMKLMQLDPKNSIYISRPCYAILPLPKSCSAAMWTSGRYSQKVIDKLSAALDEIKTLHPMAELMLIGHSGGGTLAYLLALQRSDVKALVTLAANLDHQAWSQAQNYFALTESLNPSMEAGLDPSILQVHYVGTKDEIVPPSTLFAFKQKNPNALFIAKKQSHNCCWKDVWPAQLSYIESLINLN